MEEYCQNCGHECHCGKKCKQEYTDGDGERYEIQICSHCRHEKKQKNKKNKKLCVVHIADTKKKKKLKI
jgi:hypothetical protein